MGDGPATIGTTVIVEIITTSDSDPDRVSQSIQPWCTAAQVRADLGAGISPEGDTADGARGSDTSASTVVAPKSASPAVEVSVSILPISAPETLSATVT